MVRQFTTTIQYVLMVTEELVNTQMVKYPTSLSRESIVDIQGEAIERLEALYPTLKELVLVGSPSDLYCRNYEEYRFSPPAFNAKILKNTSSYHRPSLPEF
ncbi:hypothetical protein IEQ34_006518 [Dendrobium chrysotoxum]|uniref:Uncharacterized protein n=1 Tax=Dendrobium chrysotoxum TaxID=161865 RepID=A0AAV7H5S9_DENCH|nr:hypothetical protein IEQ34_006518 [Dendrobium chrysotoxum]